MAREDATGDGGPGPPDKRPTSAATEGRLRRKSSGPGQVLYHGRQYRHVRLPGVPLYSARPRETSSANNKSQRRRRSREDPTGEATPSVHVGSALPLSIRAKRAECRLRNTVVAHRSWLEELHAAHRDIEALRQQVTLELSAKRQALIAEVEQRYHEAVARANATLDFHLGQLLEAQRRVKSSATAVAAVSNGLHAAIRSRRESKVGDSEGGESSTQLEELTREAEGVATAAMGVSVEEVVAVPRLATDIPAARDFCRFCVRHRVHHRSNPRSSGREEGSASHDSHRQDREDKRGRVRIAGMASHSRGHHFVKASEETEGEAPRRSGQHSSGQEEGLEVRVQELLMLSHKNGHHSNDTQATVGIGSVRQMSPSDDYVGHRPSGHEGGAELGTQVEELNCAHPIPPCEHFNAGKGVHIGKAGAGRVQVDAQPTRHNPTDEGDGGEERQGLSQAIASTNATVSESGSYRGGMELMCLPVDGVHHLAINKDQAGGTIPVGVEDGGMLQESDLDLGAAAREATSSDRSRSAQPLDLETVGQQLEHAAWEPPEDGYATETPATDLTEVQAASPVLSENYQYLNAVSREAQNESESLFPSIPPSDVDVASIAQPISFDASLSSVNMSVGGHLSPAQVENGREKNNGASIRDNVSADEQPLPKIEWAPRPASQALQDLRHLYDLLHSPGQLLHGRTATEE